MPLLRDMILAPQRSAPHFAAPICTRPASTGGGHPPHETRPVIDGDEPRTVRGYSVHCIDGEDYLSTSTVLSIMRWGDLGHVDPFALEYGRMRGSYVDQACRCLDEGCLDIEALDPKIRPYVAAWGEFTIREPWRCTGIEAPVFNDWMRTFGYRDRIGTFDGKPCVLDLKTSEYIGTGFWLQLASYLTTTRAKACDVQLKKDGTYTLHWLENPLAWRKRFEALAHEAHEYIKEEEAREQYYTEKRRAGRRKAGG